MKISHLVVLVIGALVGALTISFIPRQRFTGSDDSPVLARGGTMDFLSQQQWTNPSSGYVYQTTGVNLQSFSMDGVEPSTSPTTFGPAEDVYITAQSTNWTVQLDYRHADESDDPRTAVQLCTSSPCSASNPIAAASPLYVVDMYQNGDFKLETPNNPSDGLYRLRFDQKQVCNDGSADPEKSRCNHIGLITLSGITAITDSSSHTVSARTFQCRAGACDIGFQKAK